MNKAHDPTKGSFAPLPPREEELATIIVDCAFKVHQGLGPGLLENIYELCFCHELTKHGIEFKRQVSVPVVYDGITFTDGLRLDVLVEDLIICELKAIEAIASVHRAQLLSQMKLTGKRLGFLINFNVPTIKSGIARLIV
jgi:GxxExxY protein